MVVVDFEKDYYAILGLESTATTEEVKRAYRVLAKKYHPDINKAHNASEIFSAITEAYEVLSDARHRAEYDAVVGVHRHGGAAREKASSAGRGSAGSPRTDSAGRNRAAQAPSKSPGETRRERIFMLSLVVPGLLHFEDGQRKFGSMLLVVYFTFWVLSMMYGVEIGVLAVLAWAVALLDGYRTLKKGEYGDAHGR